jgi:hypothetical protein
LDIAITEDANVIVRGSAGWLVLRMWAWALSVLVPMTMIFRLAAPRQRRIVAESRCLSHSTAIALTHGYHETECEPATATHYMSNTTEARCSKTKTRNDTLCLVLRAFLGIPVLLICSCTSTPVKHYTLASQGAPRPTEEAIFRVSEKTAIKPFVKIDGHYFSVGSELEGTVVDGVLRPFAEPQMRSLEVRLLPGSHKIDVAIEYMGYWSLPFNKGRTINFEANAGKSYELQLQIMRFNDYCATGNIEWGTKVIEVDTGKEFTSDPASPGQL